MSVINGDGDNRDDDAHAVVVVGGCIINPTSNGSAYLIGFHLIMQLPIPGILPTGVAVLLGVLRLRFVQYTHTKELKRNRQIGTKKWCTNNG